MIEYHPLVARIREVLDSQSVTYKTFEHEPVRTSEEAAALRPEYSLSQGAKALIINMKKKYVADDKAEQYVQIVVPGDAKFDTKKVKKVLEAKDIRFATPEEVAAISDGVQPGGVPPFGNLFGVGVVVDPSLLKHAEIIFNAGDRRYSIAMKSEDYLRVVQPQVAEVV